MPTLPENGQLSERNKPKHEVAEKYVFEKQSMNGFAIDHYGGILYNDIVITTP